MRIFCSGIGGIGLSAYASHMHLLGHEIFGSDTTDSPLVQHLRESGMHIVLTQDGSGIPRDIDLFVYSEAIPEHAPERMEARRRDVRSISYFQALGELTAGKFLIAVCGTHGKSSTTAMAARMAIEAGLDPNVVIGTKLSFLNNRNWRRGAGDLWIVEACEYRRSFLHLKPKIILLTNADGDHFDAFKDAAEYQDAFVEFLSSLPEDGIVIAHGTDEISQKICDRARRTILNADLESLPEVGVLGLHMQQNAQLVVALGKQLNLPEEKVLKALKHYSGAWRRMETRGVTTSGVTVIDDYAQHPVEIKATLAAMRLAYPNRRIVAVFQPHMHDRTLKLWNEFSTSFSDADAVVILSVYDARPDTEHRKVDEGAFVEHIRKISGKPTSHGGTLEDAEKLLRESILKPKDVVVIMGAGDSTALAGALLAC